MVHQPACPNAQTLLSDHFHLLAHLSLRLAQPVKVRKTPGKAVVISVLQANMLLVQATPPVGRLIPVRTQVSKAQQCRFFALQVVTPVALGPRFVSNVSLENMLPVRATPFAS